MDILLALDLALKGKKSFLSFRDVRALERLHLLGQFSTKEIAKEDFLGVIKKGRKDIQRETNQKKKKKKKKKRKNGGQEELPLPGSL